MTTTRNGAKAGESKGGTSTLKRELRDNECEKENKRPKVEHEKQQNDTMSKDAASHHEHKNSAKSTTQQADRSPSRKKGVKSSKREDPSNQDKEKRETPTADDDAGTRASLKQDDGVDVQKPSDDATDDRDRASNDDIGQTRDRPSTPGRNHAAMKDPKVRDNLDDPNLIKKKVDEINEKIESLPRRKGPKSAIQKDLEFERDALLDPNKDFHSLHVCYAKGPDGSPTYDEQGFELDYEKVDEWMRPKAPSRPSRRSNKSIDERQKKQKEEEQRMAELFYEKGAAPIQTSDEEHSPPLDIFKVGLWKDRVSKDLRIPWHKIGLAEFEKWDAQGFEKAKKGEYSEYTKKDSDRILGLLSGGALRK